ncbi:tRNA dihydrouridine synthase DusB [Pygmaiobacter massiliensis]|uniref:tRNA dihydrouridine synthase DusB n=1 Tax=Pygmaiobacter massiliensis TaxID=1917873 RepID=UPI002A801AD1|nr:tRNA dihydrouridine synthase DusB [Pygmaiobacter massiliensis]MDY4784140.1 tRNA dihydrouridine synthase DusB [Pygmaiobacter massiliensis]
MIDFTQLSGAAFAPMAGLSDAPARRIMAEYGAAYTVSEMVSAKALTYGDRKTGALLSGGGGCAPYGIQIFGAEPQTMAEGAKLVLKYNPDFIDINMGCPAPKITGGGAGSALMRDPALCGAIAEAVVKAVPVPVTVKLRKGWDADTVTCTEVAKRCEAAGVSLLAVHGRTREEMYTPPIDPGCIAAVKQAVGIPVLGNGDLLTATDAKQLMAETGCDGIMIGRGALGNPWLFTEIKAMLAGQPTPAGPTLKDRMDLLLRQVYAMCEEKGEGPAMRQARTQVMYFLKGLHGAAELRRAACGLTYYGDAEELVRLVYRHNVG